MSTSNQQTLADSRVNERTPMLEKGIIFHGKVGLEDNTTEQILEPLSKMTKGNKKQYIADVRVVNYLLQVIPNDFYNSVDVCKNAKDMWQQIKRLMYGSDVTSHVRYSRLMDELEKFATKEGELLESVYERLKTLVNIMNRDVVSYNELYDSLVQFKPHVQASKVKKAAKNHDALALLAHLNASLSQSHANNSYSPQPYYVTHPSSVADYEVRQNRNQAFNAGNRNDESYYARDFQKPRVHDTKYFREQMFLAMKDEARSNLKDEENDFMLDNSYGDKTLEELTAVNASNKVHEQVNHAKRKTIIHTSDDDHIDSNIIFDNPYVENNGGTSEHYSNALDEYHDIQILAYNVQRKVEKQKTIKQ
nr:hypothetical protein [Tanacetum cinerariifolium]